MTKFNTGICDAPLGEHATSGIERYTDYWVVRLPRFGFINTAEIKKWATNLFGPESDGRWAIGLHTSDAYQEFWFEDESSAIETLLVWN